MDRPRIAYAPVEASRSEAWRIEDLRERRLGAVISGSPAPGTGSRTRAEEARVRGYGRGSESPSRAARGRSGPAPLPESRDELEARTARRAEVRFPEAPLAHDEVDPLGEGGARLRVLTHRIEEEAGLLGGEEALDRRVQQLAAATQSNRSRVASGLGATLRGYDSRLRVTRPARPVHHLRRAGPRAVATAGTRPRTPRRRGRGCLLGDQPPAA